VTVRSPGFRASLNVSAQASIVPAITGVPAGRPVALARGGGAGGEFKLNPKRAKAGNGKTAKTTTRRRKADAV
jgi:hypothetical protein